MLSLDILMKLHLKYIHCMFLSLVINKEQLKLILSFSDFFSSLSNFQHTIKQKCESIFIYPRNRVNLSEVPCLYFMLFILKNILKYIYLALIMKKYTDNLRYLKINYQKQSKHRK